MRELDKFQSEIAQWSGKIKRDNTPEKEFNRALEEVEELREAIATNNSTPEAQQNIAEESADVIIGMIQLITLAGGNVAELLENKIKLIQEKYPADSIAQDIQSGIPYDKVMRQRKDAWNGRRGAQVIPLFTGHLRPLR